MVIEPKLLRLDQLVGRARLSGVERSCITGAGPDELAAFHLLKGVGKPAHGASQSKYHQRSVIGKFECRGNRASHRT